jgi:myo-inositol-1(or 4)-monophosphatase
LNRSGKVRNPLINHNEFPALLAAAASIVREGGRLILAKEQEVFSVETKSAKNFVTTVDLAVEQLIVGRLKTLTPDFPVVTEETAADPADPARPTWVLDPVDGTTNLMRGLRCSAISLALAVGGRPVIGLVYNPYADELFAGASGLGATLNGRPIFASRRDRLDDCLVGFGTTPYDRRRAHQTFSVVEELFLKSLEVRRCGVAALDLVYVACGRLDVFFEMGLQPWDYAGGWLILSEAGGLVTNWQGEAPSLRHGGSILASNGLVHEQVRHIVKTILPPDPC